MMIEGQVANQARKSEAAIGWSTSRESRAGHKRDETYPVNPGLLQCVRRKRQINSDRKRAGHGGASLRCGLYLVRQDQVSCLRIEQRA